LELSLVSYLIMQGLKEVKTGDTLLLSSDQRQLVCQPIRFPQPVFVRSVEAKSVSAEKELTQALESLLREDPSLTVHTNEETGQLLLSGMGELHLEIAGERLLDTYKVPCTLGKVEISYMEAVTSLSDSHMLNYDKNILGTHHQCEIELHVESILKGLQENADAEPVQIVIDDEVIPTYSNRLFPSSEEIKSSVADGIKGAISRGPLLGYPISHIKVTLKSIKLISPETSSKSAVRSASQTCLRQAVLGKTQLLEPIMKLVIVVPQQYVGHVTRDMTGHRRGEISSLEQQGDLVTLHCTCPLAELIGYASGLRGLTAGTGEWTMVLEGYQLVPASKQGAIIESIRGY
jgi:elongation factor G